MRKETRSRQGTRFLFVDTETRAARAHASSLFEQDGAEMFLFVEFLAKKFKLDDDFK